MIVLTEASDDIVSSVVEILKQSPGGIAVLTVVGLLVIITPILLPVIKDMRESIKEKREALKAEEERKENEYKERLKREQKNEEFQKRLEDMIDHIPKISEQVETLSSEVDSLRTLRENWDTLSTNLEVSIKNLSEEVAHIAQQSSEGDMIIQQNLQETQKMVQSLSESTEKIENNVGTIIEGDLNSFRIYLTQIYTKYVVAGLPFPRSVKQELRIRFETYSKEGGNGWARGLYNELMLLPVAPDEYSLKNINECESSNSETTEE